MDILSILSFIGGLAMFLYGMNVMSGGLEKMSGGRLERVLERATNNRIKGVLLGTGVTAVIQSSSATTVMVVGFVNSGMMKLRQAVGVIMGANIGTTATAWILSLTGIEGDSLVLTLLNPSSFSPILAIIGVVMIMFTKKDSLRGIGSILVGFAVLMFGMDAMSGAMEPLAESPEFTSILTMFENPLMGVLLGVIVTAIIQSSSASIGILQALSLSGLVTYGMAIPIIMGQNIGTCITALLSCIGASKNAKRAAMVHLYFNLIGSVLFLSLFYLGNAIFHYTFLEDVLNPANIAIIHTTFNVLTTAVLLPLGDKLEKLATITIRDKEEPKPAALLDERFLNTPAFGLEQCRNLADKMADLAGETLRSSLTVVQKYSKTAAAEIEANEKKLDEYEDALGTYLVKLSGKEFSDKDSREIGKLLRVIGDFERIGDHAVNILESAQEMNSKGIHFSEQCVKELDVMIRALAHEVDYTMNIFHTSDAKGAAEIEPMEEVMDELKTELKERHINRLRKGECTIELGFIFSDLVGDMERVSDHCSNIAACVARIEEEALDMHKYAHKAAKAEGFVERVQELSKEYALPAAE